MKVCHSVYNSLLLVLIVNVTFATISPSDKKKAKDSGDLNLKVLNICSLFSGFGQLGKNQNMAFVFISLRLVQLGRRYMRGDLLLRTQIQQTSLLRAVRTARRSTLEILPFQYLVM